MPSALVHKVCGLTDPFCTHAIGAKLPDGSNARSLTYPLHLSTTMATDSLGNASMIFVPNYLYAPFTQASVITGVVATYSDPLVLGSRLANVSGYRITSFGVKLRGISAPLTTSGTLAIRGFGQKAGAQLGTTSTVGFAVDWYEDVSLRKADEVCIIARKLDGTSDFFSSVLETTPSSDLTDWVSPGWGAFQVSVVGGPASVNVLTAEIFLNMEVTFADGESLALLATPPPKYSPEFQAITREVSSTGKSVFLKGAEQVGKWAIQAAGRAAMNAIAKRYPVIKAGQLALEVD